MNGFVETYAPVKGEKLAQVKAFLAERKLRYETDAELTAILRDENGKIGATGSLAGNVLKYIAVSEGMEGTGAAASIVSELITNAYRMGRKRLFLYTSPGNAHIFQSLGFYTVVETGDIAMMENARDGIEEFLQSLDAPREKRAGAIVVNCNPLTNGHLYLMEQAAKVCDVLHVFVLSEDRSEFPASVRLDLVKRGTEHIKNIRVHPSGDYLVSYATFPTYFIKDAARASDVQADLDIALFGKRIAPALGIQTRFVGTEPFCAVTRAYNERMKELLPQYGVELVEIERKDSISASAVRRAMAAGDMETVRRLVPRVTYEYIQSHA